MLNGGRRVGGVPFGVGRDLLGVVFRAAGVERRRTLELEVKLGERVASEGKVITFDPMNARDRRVVHMALRDIKGVRTESSGLGQDRRVQLIPGDAPAGARAQD